MQDLGSNLLHAKIHFHSRIFVEKLHQVYMLVEAVCWLGPTIQVVLHSLLATLNALIIN